MAVAYFPMRAMHCKMPCTGSHSARYHVLQEQTKVADESHKRPTANALQNRCSTSVDHVAAAYTAGRARQAVIKQSAGDQVVQHHSVCCIKVSSGQLHGRGSTPPFSKHQLIGSGTHTEFMITQCASCTLRHGLIQSKRHSQTASMCLFNHPQCTRYVQGTYT